MEFFFTELCDAMRLHYRIPDRNRRKRVEGVSAIRSRWHAVDWACGKNLRAASKDAGGALDQLFWRALRGSSHAGLVLLEKGFKVGAS